MNNSNDDQLKTFLKKHDEVPPAAHPSELAQIIKKTEKPSVSWWPRLAAASLTAIAIFSVVQFQNQKQITADQELIEFMYDSYEPLDENGYGLAGDYFALID